MTRSARWRRLIESLKIRTRDLRILPLRLNYPQERLWNVVAPKIDRGEPIRVICLKARREGISTLIEALLVAFVTESDYVQALVTAHLKRSSEKIWQMSRRYVETSDVLAALATVGANSITMGHSMLEVTTAGSPDTERGGDLTAWHGCLAPDTPIVISDGRLVAISEVRAGDRVRTHSGAIACVRRVWSRPAHEVSERGEMVSLRLWTNRVPLSLTPDHKCWTSRGWVQAADLRIGDELGTPIRTLSGSLTQLPLKAPGRRGGRGRQSTEIDHPMTLTRETGFFFGYYLAEGSIKHQTVSPQRACHVAFAAHTSEGAYAARAIGAVEAWTTSVSQKQRVGPKTLVTILYGSTLAEIVEKEFGAGDTKRIPDWVFDAPREFAEGLIEGYVCGDGSKGTDQRTYFNARISITSVRPGLLVQVRNLLASLGWGWASILRRNAETFIDARGWTNRPAWLLEINGRPALTIRRLLGWLLPPEGHRTRREREVQEKYRIGEEMVWVRVRRVERRFEDRVFDLEVDHADHSFETLCGVVANSEAAYFPYADVMTATMQSLPDDPTIFSMAFLESTANGKVSEGRLFYEEWQRAQSGESGWTPLFIACHEMPSYRLPGARVEQLSAEERELKIRFEVDDAFLAWRRAKIAGDLRGNVDKFHQEYPTYPEEAFIQSGLPFFRPAELLPLEKALRPGKKYTITPDGKLAEDPQGYLEIWKMPEAGHTYVCGADSSMGLSAEDDDDDRDTHSRSAAEVIDMETMEQVAEYDAASAPHIMARHLAGIGRLYNEALLAPEIQSSGGGGGRELLVYLYKDLEYYNIHRWTRNDDRIQPHEAIVFGWETNSRTRPRMLARMREVVDEKCATIHSRRLFGQLTAFGENDSGRLSALSGHDDLLFAWGIAIMSRTENYFEEPKKVVTPNWPEMGIRFVNGLDPTGDEIIRRILATPADQPRRSFLDY